MKNYQVEDETLAKVGFYSSYSYLKNEEMIVPQDHIVYTERKEYVLECSDWVLKEKLVNIIKSQDKIFPQISPLITFLETEKIPYFISKKAISF